MSKQAFVFWGFIALAIVGTAVSIIRGDYGMLSVLLIPLIVFGIVLLLYKFPPRRGTKTPKIKPSAKTMAKAAGGRKPTAAKKRKEYPFYVIEGQKGKNNDDVPKYH
ncbi:hypothetical protein ACE41H_16625 [Paenibacillus enshidis]|uniref:DUF2207 domain-containing protein n=1 Tax=Paenibacillus enshidis TaxID=1458439 RepID=A0ABV5AYC8_9BACL